MKEVPAHNAYIVDYAIIDTIYMKQNSLWTLSFSENISSEAVDIVCSASLV